MLARIKGMSRGGWIAVGLLAGAIAAPGIALAAFSDIRLVSIDGSTVAQVTPNHQLRIVESDPKLNRMLFVVPGAGGACTPSQPIPGTTGAFVLKQAQFDVYILGATGQGVNVSLFEGPACGGNPIARINPAAVGSSVVPFDPGIAMKPGQVFSARAVNLSAEIYLHGYIVTASAVAENTPVIGAPGIPARRSAQQGAVRKRR